MSDRIKGFTVALEKSLKYEDAEATLNAIRQIRGVISVTPEEETNGDMIVRMQELHSLRMKLWDALK